MRVLLKGDVDLSLPGGLETHLRELALALAERGHRVEVLGRPAALPPYAMVGVLDPSRYDILHHQGGTWPRALDRHPGLVRTFHFATAAKMRAYLRIGRVRTLLNLPNWRAIADERASARRAGPIIAVSSRLRDELAREYAIPPARVRVIGNGVRLAAPTHARADWRRRWGLDPDAPVLLTIGRDDFVKGHDLLERAWEAAKRPAGATWVSVGGAREDRGPGRLVTGPASPADVAAWIGAADVGAQPSYYEGGGIALLEMLEGGLYSLTHDVGCAREVVRAGDNGEIVGRDAGAWSVAIGRALATRPGARRPDGLGPAHAWAAVAEATERVYEEALAGR